MRTKIYVMVIVLFLAGLVAASVVHAKGCAASGASTEGGNIVNSTCPMSGKKISSDTPYRTQHEGNTIGFCCSGCKSTFEADPAKYSKNIEEK